MICESFRADGKVSWMVVPFPGADRIARSPPNAAARSRIPRMPAPTVRRDGEKPHQATATTQDGQRELPEYRNTERAHGRQKGWPVQGKRVKDNEQRENRHDEISMTEGKCMQILALPDQCGRLANRLAHQQLAETAVNQDHQKRPERNRLGVDPERLRPESPGDGHTEQERNRPDKTDRDPLRAQQAF